ncbi:formylglycine-generating enzyme family protein [Sorangium sp. So ce1153]|uniref:formylglycine-generating enzyme family protein n=1 Tax=Sorangium sp. So ce1153 TaxID=3133333 RepID=UPI003F61B126
MKVDALVIGALGLSGCGCTAIAGLDLDYYAAHSGGGSGGDETDAGGHGGQAVGGGASGSGSSGTGGGGGGTGGSGDGECTPDEKQCSGNVPQRCIDGRWESDIECHEQTCVNGECIGECAAGEVRCVGNIPERCDEVGRWHDEGQCHATAPLCIDGRCTHPPSCDGLPANCGASKDENCCASAVIPGGTFNRGNNDAHPATVSEFRLDRFETTVGRFRAFVAAYPESKPASGAGANLQIRESGWNTIWDGALPPDAADLRELLKCDSAFQTWTDDVGMNERLPINCLSWYDAFAFCAWDGGRLPTEAEWNYAAAGGDEQRQYPWSIPPDSTSIDGKYASYDCLGDESDRQECAFADILAIGSKSPLGDGRWGQSDLGGGLWEWVLDWHAGYSAHCDDCANLAPSTSRVTRGGSWSNSGSYLLSSYRNNSDPEYRNIYTGVRCARIP